MKLIRKISIASIIASASVFSINSFASTMNSYCTITHQTLSDLTCNGPAEIKDSTITGDVIIKGSAKLTHVTIKGTLTVSGPVEISNGSTITGKSHINGPMEVDNSKLAELEINGPLDIEDSVVLGKTTINGYLDAEHTVFEGEIIASTNRIELEKSKVKGNLIITSDEPPMVKLEDSTIVNGKVIFKNKSGTVIKKDQNSSTGNVENGSTISKS